ncbi:DegT/DnrJ/EryC1/StrS family aminotransferase [Accumulibacter sp.]|uniref:DegT/DnrJ/EryC1/StrS family aminotransferase n=1 Tax=Accumulibacter sp. TaxID=2053492 RepID=UPI00257B73C2|nr:DegT/DnrJ/EryC1/StrS family aminotransferase [Accumulibacter sp.]
MRAELAATLCGRIRRSPAARQLADGLAKLLNVPHVLAVNSGRTALRVGLEALMQLRPGRNEVIVPAFICPAVIEVVSSLGLLPLAAAVGPDLNFDPGACVQRIGSRTLAIIVADMYGCPAQIEAFEIIASTARVFLVDDAVQVVGESADGLMLGTFGDFGVLSFAQSKCVVTGESGGGGALICHQNDILSIVRERVEALAPAGGQLRALTAFVWNYLLESHTASLSYRWQRLRQHFPGGRPPALEPGRISNLDAQLALAQLNSLSQRREQRLRILGQDAHALASAGASGHMPQFSRGRYLARVMVSMPPGVDLESCRRQLRQGSVCTRQGYPTPLGGPRSAKGMRELAASLIELPAYAEMTAGDVAAVCQRLHRVAAASRKPVPNRQDGDDHEQCYQ